MQLGVLPLLTLIFLTLKLCGVIAWSWVWVLAPTWIPLGFAALAFMFAGFCAAMGMRSRSK